MNGAHHTPSDSGSPRAADPLPSNVEAMFRILGDVAGLDTPPQGPPANADRPAVAVPSESAPLPNPPDGTLLGAYESLLDDYMPPSLLVGADRGIIQSFAGASRFLKPRDGRFSADVLDLIEPSLRSMLADALKRAMTERRPVNCEPREVPPAGTITMTVRPVVNRRDGTPCALVRLEGLPTEGRDAEERDRLIAAVLQRDRFLAVLSHELRNPLAAILNATGMITATGPPDGAAGTWVGVIERRARHMARLLDDLLDMTRLTQNKMDLRKRVYDLAATAEDAVEEVTAWFAERRVQLTLTKPPGLLPVEGDPARLQQIQVNLLMNAAKFTPAGGRVWFTLEAEAGQAVIRVRDTGVGIPRELVERVFDLFVQGDNAPAGSGRGIGVGLTLVKLIVELHGGRVEAKSDGPGQGSEFVVRLPLVAAPAPATEPTPSPEPTRPARPLRVLLVEDDSDIRESLAAVLTLEGYPVQAAADGFAALELVARECPDVALVDIGLPRMDGYELARRLRAVVGHRVRLVALTGYGRGSDRQAARDAGFDQHLTKPVRPKDLTAILRA